MPRKAPAVAAAEPAQTRVQPLHKYAFFQHLLRRHTITEEQAIQVLQQLISNADGATLAELMHDHNQELDTLHLKYKRLRYPVDSTTYIGLANTVDDAASKFGTHYKQPQLDFLRQVLEAIAGAPDAEEGVGRASGVQLLNLAAPAQQQVTAEDGSQLVAARPLTKQERQDTLHQLVRDGWLAHCPRCPGHFCIGLRSFIELSQMLLELEGVPEHTKDAWRAIL